MLTRLAAHPLRNKPNDGNLPNIITYLTAIVQAAGRLDDLPRKSMPESRHLAQPMLHFGHWARQVF